MDTNPCTDPNCRWAYYRHAHDGTYAVEPYPNAYFGPDARDASLQRHHVQLRPAAAALQPADADGHGGRRKHADEAGE